MKHCCKRIGCALLILVLLLSLSGTALAAGEPGEYTLTTDGGGSRKPVYETAALKVDEDGTMILELLLKSSMSGIKYQDEELSAGEAVEKDGETYIPYTLCLNERVDSLTLSAYVSAMGRDVDFTVGLSGWENIPGMAEAAEEPGVEAGAHQIAVSNASTSPYGATTVYPQASLTVGADGSCAITVWLKDSLANIRTAEGDSVPMGEAKTLTMNDTEGTYYPYTFAIEMRQASLTLLDDVPAMSSVESMNFGKDMTTTVNIDWNSVTDLAIEALADGAYTLPVAFQTPSSMLTLEPEADLTVSSGRYALTVAFGEGVISALTYGDGTEAAMTNSCSLDRYTIELTEEAGQIPVKLEVARMKDTAMAVQSFVIVPDWTKAVKAEAPAAETEDPGAYDGDEVTFLKADGSAFGMFAPQEGTTAKLQGENVVIHFVPKNTTVYNSIHWGAIEDELTPDLAFNEDGTFDITLPKAMSGRLIPVAPIKVKDGGTTKEQYYLAIPAAEKLAGSQVQAATQKLLVNGEEKEVGVYRIGGGTYFRLRDIAALLTGSSAQFGVDYDEASRTVIITAGEAYTALASDLQALEDKSETAAKSSQSVQLNGETVELEAYNIGGWNFFKLSDLGTKLGFDVGYDMAAGAVTVAGK